ncbi:hypothetical protein PPL_10593 [Heterostelium album PN500]|uniref:Uncharacterized protein n=1 Tax=Heterostelium pallidum (strain ATCC 26659 / Pp 5 / PN500) TaxID=670386 RepID=D3BRI2_HETP5|nr:hypothetical protein PPL_10593 [Heterostelium album PN500]EFA76014.1 hypothetical protein PPL_10593 [Heterostelium album PN500]|eukprot:XP_020428148.1 hypothetical protein PPL_10593 [Heterostelium album PN500]
MEFLVYSKLLKNPKNDELFWPKDSPMKKTSTKTKEYNPPAIQTLTNASNQQTNSIGIPNKQESGSILR